VDLRWAAPAYREVMHRGWNAFIGATTRGKRDATIEPLQERRPRSYGCFELHKDPDPDYWENRTSHTISPCASCGWSATVTEPDKRHFVPNGQKLVNRFRALWREFLLRKKRVMEFRVRPYLLPRKVKHIHGPAKISYALDELLVISVVRNGELYIRSFLDHYRSMGVRHFVFLDNGSADHTLEMLRKQEEVTVLQTEAPYNKYENTMKRYLAERFSCGRWNLCADIDELFDYPFSEKLSLRDFLGYLNNNNYTAVVAQMLDMFSDVPLQSWKARWTTY
jgi:Glycosyl transferase family 2